MLDGFARLSELTPLLLQGAWVTLQIAAMSLVATVVVAFAVGMARLSEMRPLRAIAIVFVELFRGTSLIVQLFVLYYILPLYHVRLSADVTAVLGISLNLGAYGSEIVRSAIAGIGRGQREAAISLALPRWITFLRIVLPQAMLVMLPSFGNLAIEIVKATALVSLITISELTYTGHSLINATGSTSLVWLIILLMYLAISTPLNLLVAWAEKRAGRFRQENSSAV